MASWFASTGASPGAAAFPQTTMNGGPVGGVAATAPNGFNVNGVPLNGGANVNGNGNAGMNGMGGVGGMQGQGFTYDERSWYDYQ